MSDNIQEDLRDNILENQRKFSSMGNLQHSINRSLEMARSSKPSYQKGDTKSANHLVYEMNEFYLEMAQKISELNVKRYDAFIDEDEDVEDTDSVLYEVVTAIRKKRNDPEIKKQIQTVLKLDEIMEDTYKTLKHEKLERQSIQDELCNLIDEQDDGNSRSRFFKHLCDLEQKKVNVNSSKINQLVEELSIEKHYQNEKVRNVANGGVKKDDKFIKRNIQLAKNTNMYNPSCSLTDEEKVKLESLLSDIDVIDENEQKAGEQSEVSLESCELPELPSEMTSSSTNYPFSFSQDDEARLRELETELQSLSEQSHLGNKSATPTFVENDKQWLKDNRLKHIDEKLEKLQSERESFVYTPNASVPVVYQGAAEHQSAFGYPLEDNDNTFNDVDSISYDTIREQSQHVIAHISSVIKDMEEDLGNSDEEAAEAEAPKVETEKALS